MVATDLMNMEDALVDLHFLFLNRVLWKWNHG